MPHHEVVPPSTPRLGWSQQLNTACSGLSFTRIISMLFQGSFFCAPVLLLFVVFFAIVTYYKYQLTRIRYHALKTCYLLRDTFLFFKQLQATFFLPTPYHPLPNYYSYSTPTCPYFNKNIARRYRLPISLLLQLLLLTGKNTLLAPQSFLSLVSPAPDTICISAGTGKRGRYFLSQTS